MKMYITIVTEVETEEIATNVKNAIEATLPLDHQISASTVKVLT